jgi:hypothetical protein
MSASIHTLQRDASASVPESPAAQMINALEHMASGLITQQLEVMFTNADDVLFEMANKTRSGNDQTVFLETMRTVRRERPRILRAFKTALHEALGRKDDAATAGGEPVNLDDLESWTLQESSDLEEKIAISNMDAKAESMYASELAELEQRLARLSDDSHGAVSAKALSPGRILDAFRTSMKGLEVESPIRLVIYKLFDRVVVSSLGQVFTGANRLLAEGGVQPKKPADRPAPKKATAPLWMPPGAGRGGPPASPSGAASAPGEGLAGLPGTIRPEVLLAAMQHYLQAGMPAPVPAGPVPAAAGGAGPGSLAHQNAQLADEMLSVLEAASRGRPVSSWMPKQNLMLVSRMFDDLYADPQMPEGARPLLGRLQFPVMKLAMSDPSFFENPSHPVRALVHDVHQALTGTRVPGGGDFQRLEELIQDLLAKFDPDPAHLRASARQAKALSDEEAERFLEQQKLRLEQQRRAFEEKVRRLVAQEMRLHIGERRIPKPVLQLVLSGFGPMLVADYHAGGHEHTDWKETLGLFDRLLDALDNAAANVAGRADSEAALIAEIGGRLRDSGFPAARVEQLTHPLHAVFEELAAAAPEEAAAAMAVPSIPAPPTAEMERARAVQRLLRGGDWFKVWCADARNCRWLKLVSHYAGADTLVFEDFGGDNCLKMSAKAFLADLAGGRSAPVDPDPSLAQLLPLLGPADPPFDQRAAWYKPQVSPPTP